MGKKINTSDVIERCKKVHGDEYDYSLTEYINSKTPLAIKCRKHGVFYQLLCNHLKGCGCPSCGGNKRMTTEEYIERMKEKCTNENISFEKVKYVNNHTPIIITCKAHGDWSEWPTSLLKNIECPECQKERLHNLYASTTLEFKGKAKEVHGDKYIYDKSEYVDCKTKLCITCPTHGDFWQTPNTHLKGCGCPKCGQDNMWDKRGRMTTEKLIERFKEIHNDEYDYHLVEYKSPKEKVEIICKEHGSFFQLPYSHLNGNGCPKCALNKLSNYFSKTTEEFINESKELHGDEFDYTKTHYKNSQTKVEIICKKHGSFWQNPMSHLKGIKCPMCYAELSVSKNEIDLQNFIKGLCEGEEVRFNVRNVISPLELDIVNDTKKIAIEYDGLYWHSDIKIKDKQYHLKKTKFCSEKGFKLIHIFEDEWLEKREIVEGVLEEIFHKEKTIIDSSECVCKEIGDIAFQKFLMNNHIEGYEESAIKYGLFHNRDLVGVIGFIKNSDESYRINRYCNKLHYRVINGVETLLNKFIKDIKPSKIALAINKRFNDFEKYQDLGFKFIKDTEPSPFYTSNGKDRFSSDDIDITNKYHKIYDCGMSFFEKTFDY